MMLPVVVENNCADPLLQGEQASENPHWAVVSAPSDLRFIPPKIACLCFQVFGFGPCLAHELC